MEYIRVRQHGQFVKPRRIIMELNPESQIQKENENFSCVIKLPSGSVASGNFES